MCEVQQHQLTTNVAGKGTYFIFGTAAIQSGVVKSEGQLWRKWRRQQVVIKQVNRFSDRAADRGNKQTKYFGPMSKAIPYSPK